MTAPTSHEENSITNIAHGPTIRSIVVGVDTHKDAHVAVALDLLGARLSDLRVPSTLAGYSQLVDWAADLGAISAIAVEGTNCYGAGLTRFVTGHGHTVVEVNRPDRALRRRRGKSDTIDAEAAARAVLSGIATAAPKASDGTVEMIRMLKTAKNSAVKARTQALNQIHAIVLTAPAALREELAELRTPALTERCAGLRPGELSSPAAVARHTLRLLARRALALLAEVTGLNSQIEILAKLTAPRLIDTYGVGPDGAAALLLTAGDNPERLHSEAAFAALCGASPIPASSGKTNRHRLNRGGDRQANAALHRVVVVRLRWHQPTRDYMARRLTQGKTKAEIIRCLKRYVAREIYHVLMVAALAVLATFAAVPIVTILASTLLAVVLGLRSHSKATHNWWRSRDPWSSAKRWPVGSTAASDLGPTWTTSWPALPPPEELSKVRERVTALLTEWDVSAEGPSPHCWPDFRR